MITMKDMLEIANEFGDAYINRNGSSPLDPRNRGLGGAYGGGFSGSLSQGQPYGVSYGNTPHQYTKQGEDTTPSRILSGRGKDGEPQKTYMWEVVIYSDDNPHGEKLGAYAKSTAIAPRVNDNIKKYVGGMEYSIIGRETSPKLVRVTFWDDVGMSVYKFIHTWYKRTQIDSDRKLDSLSNLRKNLDIKLLGNDGYTARNIFTYTDCIPFELGEIQLNYSESGEITFDAVFAYYEVEVN